MTKRMTLREKKENENLRKELKKRGLLPEKKKRLNRRKFVENVRNEYLDFDFTNSYMSIILAIGFMYPSKYETKITSEQIGVVKFLKAAMEIDKLEDKNNIEEILEKIIQPLIKL